MGSDGTIFFFTYPIVSTKLQLSKIKQQKCVFQDGVPCKFQIKKCVHNNHGNVLS